MFCVFYGILFLPNMLLILDFGATSPNEITKVI